MANIVVCLSDPAEHEEVVAALRLKRHEVAAACPFSPDATPRAAAEAVLAAGADVVVLDYDAEDAASVKMLQAATDREHAPRFIFVMPPDLPSSHVVMAVNEGASALLERPVNTEILANYVERAMSGPARFRFEAGRDGDALAEISEMERDAKTMKVQLAAYRKLVSYLLSTPSSAQHRTALVVSDSAYQRDYMRKLLEDHGFHVDLAANPDDGLQAALEHGPRVVISDFEMEGKNGIEFCHELKIVNKFMPCYFVICTANAEKINTVMAPGNGVDACVIKPSNESGNRELVATVAMGLLLQ